jgi:hypothetical protein
MKKTTAREHKKSIDEKIESFNLPNYTAVEKANSLLETLLLNYPIKNLDDEQKNAYFIIPSLFIRGNSFDTNIYSAAALLGLLVFSVKNLYRKHNIDFDETKFLNDEELADVVPSSFILGVKELNTRADLEDLCLGVAIRFVECIENQFYFMRDYDSRKTNPNLEKEMKIKIQKIKDYAKIGVEVAEILRGFDLPGEAGEVAQTMAELTNSEKLWRYLQREDHYIYLNNLLKLHAHLGKVTYNNDVFSFFDLTGTEITAVIHLARGLNYYFHLASDFAIKNEERLVIPFGKDIYLAAGGCKISQYFKKDFSGTIAELIRSDERLLDELILSKSPFNNLESRLHALGVPSQLAKEVSRYLSHNILQRSLSHPQQGNSFNKGEVYKELYFRGRHFASALYYFIHKLTGKKPHKMSYKFFSSDENLHNADGITTMTYVAHLDKDGKIESIYEEPSKLPPDEELIFISTIFREKGVDAYVIRNRGVSFLLDSNPIGDIFEPEVSIIESRDSYKDVAELDKFGARLLNIKIDFHEAIHAAQVGSRLKWRGIATYVASYLCDLAIKQIQIGRLHSEFPYQRVRNFITKGKSWRDIILELYDATMVQSLGEGKLADNMRVKGIHNALWDANVGIDEDGSVKIDDVTKIVSIENSLTASYFYEWRTSLASFDLFTLENLEKKIKSHLDELFSIIETMADAYSLIATEEFLKHLPDRRYKEKKADYLKSLYLNEYRKGIFANVFIEISSTASSKKEFNARLAEHGLKYQQYICKDEHEKPLYASLMKLGYNPVDPLEAYDNIPELIKRAKRRGLKIEDLLYPFNAAKAMIGLRYNSNLPLFLDLTDKYGRKEAFKRLLNMESLSQIREIV